MRKIVISINELYICKSVADEEIPAVAFAAAPPGAVSAEA
jgi:hypothetical protein